jgi:hypothetical protein
MAIYRAVEHGLIQRVKAFPLLQQLALLPILVVQVIL